MSLCPYHEPALSYTVFLRRDLYAMYHAEYTVFTLGYHLQRHRTQTASLFVDLFEEELNALGFSCYDLTMKRDVDIADHILREMLMLDEMNEETVCDVAVSQMFGSLKYWVNYLKIIYGCKFSNTENHPNFLGPVATQRY